MKTTRFAYLILFIFTFLLLSSCLTWSNEDKAPPPKQGTFIPEPILQERNDCSSTKEFVTTYNYLLDSKSFKLEENAAYKIANKVASGCSGAAKRFIQVSELLVRAKLDTRSSFDLATEFANSTDSKASAFIIIFKKSYLGKYLDLDLSSSIKLAKSLSVEFNGDSERAKSDFESITDFCLTKKNLDLAKPTCASLAAKITKYGEKYQQSVADKYIEAVNFLLTSKSSNIALFDAMNIADQLVAIGPAAVDNFIQAYQFALSKKGLKLPYKNAIRFGTEMAAKSVVKPENLPAH